MEAVNIADDALSGPLWFLVHHSGSAFNERPRSLLRGIRRVRSVAASLELLGRQSLIGSPPARRLALSADLLLVPALTCRADAIPIRPQPPAPPLPLAPGQEAPLSPAVTRLLRRTIFFGRGSGAACPGKWTWSRPTPISEVPVSCGGNGHSPRRRRADELMQQHRGLMALRDEATHPLRILTRQAAGNSPRRD